MTERLPARNQLISYLTLRRATGLIGILLPAVLITGNRLVFSAPLPLSLSDYYYTHMRNVLVGALIVLGVFMLCYVGYDEWDRWITNGAGLFLIGIAFFPTAPGVAGDIHYAVAGVAFILLPADGTETGEEPGLRDQRDHNARLPGRARRVAPGLQLSRG